MTMTSLYSRVISFDVKNSYRPRTLDELNSLSDVINNSKFKLSNSLQYYLQKYRQLLDIPRLCRALAIPGELADAFIRADGTNQQQQRDELDKIKHITDQIADILHGYLKDNSSSDLVVTVNLNEDQKEAICTDINELAVYSKMYYDIETVKLDPLISDEYPYGNPFDHIMDIMTNGAIIVRLKYVSRNKLLPPQEKVTSYHIMNFQGRKVLGVHVEGDKKFSMYKKWGEGDEKLVPIYPEYKDTIIRWGKEEAASIGLGREGEEEEEEKYNNEKEFLY
jgi:hypothetical protein